MSTEQAAIARRAYETLEPFHVLAYFNPGLGDAQTDLGLDGHAFYRRPDGRCHGSGRSRRFLQLLTRARRIRMGPRSGRRPREGRRTAVRDARRAVPRHPGAACERITPLLPEYEKAVGGLPVSGRPLGAAWASTPIPDAPHLALWRHLSVLREWRGDNHIAELIGHGLDGIDAGVFHEAALPDPTVRRRVMGHRFFLLTRGWSEDDWDASVDRLARRGLVEIGDDGHRLTSAGFDLYQDIEARTDLLTGASLGTDVADLIERTRPFVKPVLDAGVLPGTSKKS